MRKIEKGSKVTVAEMELTVTKISRRPGGVMDGSKKVGDQSAIKPLYRVYLERPDGSKTHQDFCANPDEIEVVVG